MQPGPKPLAITQSPRLAQQHEECGLKGILDIAAIAKHSPANAEHHRPMAVTRTSNAPSSPPANRRRSWPSKGLSATRR